MKNYPPIILSKFKQKINRERTPKNLLSSLNFLPCSDIIFQTVDIIFLVFIISQQTHTQGQGLKNCKTIEKKRAHLLHNYKKNQYIYIWWIRVYDGDAKKEIFSLLLASLDWLLLLHI